jgi:hypothetical protein
MPRDSRHRPSPRLQRMYFHSFSPSEHRVRDSFGSTAWSPSTLEPPSSPWWPPRHPGSQVGNFSDQVWGISGDRPQPVCCDRHQVGGGTAQAVWHSGQVAVFRRVVDRGRWTGHRVLAGGRSDMGQAGGLRLVLSRKGFDSDFGGRPSPIGHVVSRRVAVPRWRSAPGLRDGAGWPLARVATRR